MYEVKFTYTVVIPDNEVANEDEARERAFAEFIDNGDYQFSDVTVKRV